MTLKEKYINPFTDFGFKKLFGTELNKDLLIDFLNEVVLPKERKIVDLAYKSTERMGATQGSRTAIFDLYCQGSNGEYFIVEMQQAKQNYFKDRSVFYSSFPIQDQALQGEWDFKLTEVYTVGILDFVFSDYVNPHTGKSEAGADDAEEVRHVVQLKDQHCRVFFDKLTLIYLLLPNFKKTIEELETPFDKWLYVLKNLPKLEERPAKLRERIFERLFQAAEIAKFTKEEKMQYESSIKVYRDIKNVIDYAKDEGKAEGKIVGIAEGVQIGEEKQRNQGILKALKRGKLRIEEIAEDAEVSVETVLQIKKANNL